MNKSPEQKMALLREQQRAFAAHVFDDDKSSSGLRVLKGNEGSTFTDDQRFQVYHNNIFIGLREALLGIYPVINKLVGDEFFDYVSREYSHQYPSRSGNLHAFGEAFPRFLAGFPGVETLVYLPDVARLEWAYHQVFHAPESEIFNFQKLSLLDEEASSHLRFELSSSCYIFSSPYPVLKIWQANQDDADECEVDLDEGGVQLVVRRLGFDVIFESLNKEVFALLHTLSKGHLFVEACEEAVAVDPNCDVGAILKGLIEKRMLTGFSCT